MNTLIEIVCDGDRRSTREADAKLSLAATLSEVLYMAEGGVDECVDKESGCRSQGRNQ